jgi:hypothetical protein
MMTVKRTAALAKAREALKQKRAAKKRRAKQKTPKPHARPRGIAPLPAFDLETIPPSALLTPIEVAGCLRKSVAWVRKIQRLENHPLRFEPVAGKFLCRAQLVKDYIADKTT